MPARDFEILEHTADKGIAATGPTLEEAFENAAYGMFCLMADLPRYSPTDTTKINVSGSDRETLFANWLRELLFSFEVDRVLPVDFHITSLEEWELEATLAVRPIGPDIVWLGSPVKAITYHELSVEQVDGAWRVQAIVDV